MSKDIGKLNIPKSLENKLSQLYSSRISNSSKKNENIIGTNTPPTPPALPKQKNLELSIKEDNKNIDYTEKKHEKTFENIVSKNGECEFYLKCSDKTLENIVNKIFYKNYHHYKNKKDLIILFSGIFIGIIIRLTIF